MGGRGRSSTATLTPGAVHVQVCAMFLRCCVDAMKLTVYLCSCCHQMRACHSMQQTSRRCCPHCGMLTRSLDSVHEGGRTRPHFCSLLSYLPCIPLTQVKQLLQASTTVYIQAASMLDHEVSVAVAGSCFRAVLQMHLVHMQLVLQRVLQLQALKPARMQNLLTTGMTAPLLALVLGLPCAEMSFLVGPLGTVAGAQYGSGSSTSACGWRKATLAGAEAALRGGNSAQWGAFVLGMQEELLLAINTFGKAALALHAQHHAAGSAASTPGTSSSTSNSPATDKSQTVSSVQQLLQKLPQVWESVQQDASTEMAEVLQALFTAEFGRGYGNMASFMRGHLHQCPNGHFFVIGECGGAMEESRCVECGAAVGGSSHQLVAGNRHADEAVLQQLSQHVGTARRPVMKWHLH